MICFQNLPQKALVVVTPQVTQEDSTSCTAKAGCDESWFSLFCEASSAPPSLR